MSVISAAQAAMVAGETKLVAATVDLDDRVTNFTHERSLAASAAGRNRERSVADSMMPTTSV